MTLTGFRDLLLELCPNVYHYEGHKADAPYIVWEEYRKIDTHADNRPHTGFWRVQVDYYTPLEFDPVPHTMERAFADAGVSYNYRVSRERDLRLIRHLFDCEVI